MGGLANPQPSLTNAAQIVEEIKQAHATMSPAAQQAADTAIALKAPAVAASATPAQGLTPPPINAVPTPKLANTTAAPDRLPAPGMAHSTAPAFNAPPSPTQPEIQGAPAVDIPNKPLGLSSPPMHMPLGSSLGLVPDTAAEANLRRLQTGPVGPAQIHNPFLRGLATVGDAIGTTFAPRALSVIPGTTLHHNAEVGRAEGAVAAERGKAAEDRTAEEAPIKNAEMEARTADLAAKPDLTEAKADAATAKTQLGEEHQHGLEDIAKQKDEATLRTHGYKHDPESGEIVPLDYHEMSEEQQAVHDLKASQSEAAEATAALKKAQATNSPQQTALAQARVTNAQRTSATAARRLGLSEQQFEFRSQGTVNGVAPPGQLISDDGRPIGTANATNVRPTGLERNKADLASSAHDRLDEMRQIVKRRPDIFGPAAGRTTDLSVWLGSQDPDAQAFNAAKAVAVDHLAGVFGGRSNPVLQKLDNAAGAFKTNPDAILSGINELDKSTTGFKNAGTVHTVGSNAEKTEPHGGDPAMKAYADKYFGGDVSKAQAYQNKK